VTDQLAAEGLDESWATPKPESAVTPDAGTPPDPTDPPPSAEADAERTRRLRRPRRQRISKWDRPPEPHDWRFFVGHFGKALIVTGLMMFGFVAYQLWGTGIETARAQSSLKNEFQELVTQNQAAADQDGGDASADANPPLADAPVNDVNDVNDTDVGIDVADQPDDAAAGEPAPSADGSGSDDDSGGAVSATSDAPPVAVEQDIPPILRGDPVALLQIPAIGRSDAVVQGVSLDDLKSGPGHYPDTPYPGQLGNASIAGHRTTYGAPFFDIDDLVPGDEIIVTMLTGDRFVYDVTGTEIVSASDYWVVTTSDPNIAELTLTSCHPKYTARDRIVVHSLLNPAKSANVGLPSPSPQLEPADQPIPGDDPVLVADATAEEAAGENPDQVDPSDSADLQPAVGDTDSGDGSIAADPEPASAEPDTSGATPDENQGDNRNVTATPIADDPPAEVGDAFSQGWFDDRDAFGQVALWGLALILISIGAHRISRRYRHDSIGILAGFAPFMFALYFFFQNVNRLLPPGL